MTNLLWLLLGWSLFIHSSKCQTTETTPSSALPNSEYLALYDLFNSAHGSYWIWKEPFQTYGYPWNFSTTGSDINNNPCSLIQPWQGVNCSNACIDNGNNINSSCHIEELKLHAYNLSGYLPNSIGNLTGLTYLSLSNDSLTGTIPSTIGQCNSLLELDLGRNHLQGTIPIEIGNLTSLQYMYLYDNVLTGTIPSTFGNFQHLLYLYLNLNYLTGTIPQFLITDLILLEKLYLNHNRLNGTIPTVLSNSVSNTRLRLLYLQNNEITGTIPSDLSNLINLEFLMLYSNQLTGTIPISLGYLLSLKELYLYSNKLTGTIPSSLTNSSSLTYLLLTNNRLTGTIPDMINSTSAWNSKSRLRYVTLSSNFLTGTIPSSLFITLSQSMNQNHFNHSTATYIHGLEFYNNLLTGKIPVEVGNTTSITYLEVDSNELTGSLPSTLGELKIMRSLQVQFNQFTGSMSDSFSQHQVMIMYYLSNNYFTGNIHAISRAPSPLLQQLYLHRNMFSGTAFPSNQSQSIASSTTSSSIQKFRIQRDLKLLEVIDLSNNFFTGSLPGDVFQNSSFLTIASLNSNEFTGSLPFSLFTNNKMRFRSLVLASNCFSGTLPSIICDQLGSGSQFQQLILDGLHSASSCTTKAIPSLSTSGLVIKNGVHGTIPPCLLQLPNINTLHLGGNDFSGTIPDVALSPSLRQLVLSSNDFTGMIPSPLWSSNLTLLDLSLNRLQGNLPSNMLSFASSVSSNITVNLQVNQLSGSVPSFVVHLPKNQVNILQGNMFSCNADRNNLPQNDPKYDSYNCGSDSTNYSLIAFGGIVVISCCLLYCLVSIQQGVMDSWKIYNACDSLVLFKATLDNLQRFTIWIAVSIMIVMMFLYGLLSIHYSSYVNSYIWSISAIYKYGVVPAVVIFIFLLFEVILITWKSTSLNSTPSVGSNFVDSAAMKQEQLVYNSAAWHQTVLICLLVAVNFIVVIVVNGLYVDAVRLDYNNQVLVTIAILISMFKIGWNTLLLNHNRFLPSLVLPDIVIIAISLFNNLLAPLFAELFISSDCFLYIVSQAPLLTFSYLQYNCVENRLAEGHFCNPQIEQVSNSASAFDVSLTPPFHYSYQCSFSLIASYSYVFVFKYVIGGCISLVVTLFLRFSSQELMLKPFVPGMIALMQMKVIDERDCSGMNKFESLLQRLEAQYTRPSSSLLRQRFVVKFVVNLSTLICFGVLFPPLALVVSIAVLRDLFMFKVLLGKIQSLHDNIENLVFRTRLIRFKDFVHNELNIAVTEIRNGVWYGLCIASGIWAFVLFDTLASSMGNIASIWIAIIMVTSPYLTVLLGKAAVVGEHYSQSVVKESPVLEVANPILMNSTKEIEMRETVS